MRLFGWRRKQPEKPKKPEARTESDKRPLGQKPGGKRPVPKIPEEEMLRARQMAQKLVGVKDFTEFCAKKQLGNPGEAFLRFYAAISQDPRVWKLEVKAEDAAEDSGKEFIRASFYGKLFMRCDGNPVNLEDVLFKRQQP